jgi:hypothetical protein
MLEDDSAVFFVDAPVGHNIAQLKEFVKEKTPELVNLSASRLTLYKARLSQSPA